VSRRGSVEPITVAQVVRTMRCADPDMVAWAVGRVAARVWREREGRAPMVALVPKTSGIGTHHMAVYPPSFRPMLQRLIRLATAERVQPARSSAAGKGRGKQLPLFRGLR
jgi:hypothetical protein